jgi:aryl-alcohol dehydrogenase-like predicted oxidoreductase
MQYRTLGRSGLKVSLLGLGSGGASQLGQRYHLSPGETDRLVKRALEAVQRNIQPERVRR